MPRPTWLTSSTTSARWSSIDGLMYVGDAPPLTTFLPVPTRFDDVRIEQDFICDMGGNWVKISNTHARCLRTDGWAFTEGYIGDFEPDAVVNPETVAGRDSNPFGDDGEEGATPRPLQEWHEAADELMCRCGSTEVDAEVAAVGRFENGTYQGLGEDYSVDVMHGTRWCRTCDRMWHSRDR